MPILLFYAEGRLYRAKANNDLSSTGEDCHGVACETSGAIYAFFFRISIVCAKKKDAYWGHTRVIKQKEGPKLFACLRVLTFT